MEKIFPVIAAVVGLVVAFCLAAWIKKTDEGTDRMKEIAGYIREGAMAFLAREYKTMVIVVVVLFLIIGFALQSWTTAVLYLCGAALSVLAGFFGMKVATLGNVRTAQAYNIPGVVVDGMDVVAVYEAAKKAVERARKGEGPTLIECKTYRWQGHHVGDPATYRKRRSETEKEDWMKKDPIPALKEAVLKAGIASEEDFDKLDRLVEDEIQAAVQFAVDSEYPPAEDAYTDVFQQGTL